MKRILKILLFTLISTNVFGTAQIPDLIIYNGDTLSLYSCPLNSYPDQDLITPQVDKTVEFVPQISGQDVPVVSVEIVPLLLGN